MVLNLQSYAGGRNLWGKDEGNGTGFGGSSCEDGLLEVSRLAEPGKLTPARGVMFEGPLDQLVTIER